MLFGLLLLTSYRSPDATVKMLISALFCIDTDVPVLTTDFKAEDILHRV
jgi:hypothetical protein